MSSIDARAALERSLNRIRLAPKDAEAWSRFYRLIGPQIRGHLFVLGERNRAHIDELTHDVLLKFLRYSPWRRDWRHLPSAGALVGYIRKITYTTFVDSRGQEPLAADAVGGEQAVDVIGEIAGPTQYDLEIAFRRWWVQLSHPERLLLKLLISDRSVADIADVLGIGYSAAGVRIHRLKQKLRNLS